MLGKDFVSMIQSGLRPVITFTKDVDELEAYPEAGMRARAISSVVKHDDIVLLKVDYTEFDVFNKQFESANYFDANGNATKTAREAGHYTPLEDLYIGLDAEIPFTIEESGRLKLYDQYRQHNKDFPGTTSYVQWLEDRLTNTDAAAQKLVGLLESHPALTIEGEIALRIAEIKVGAVAEDRASSSPISLAATEQ